MRNGTSKIKVPSSREAQSLKGQSPNSEAGHCAWWENELEEPLVLQDAPPREERHPWDLEERTPVFGESMVKFTKLIPREPSNNRLIDQIIGSGTSVGANYCEASQAVSKKDFKNTIARCVKESKETKVFLRMVVASEPALADQARPLYREAHELLCIFASMRKNDDGSSKTKV